MNILIFSANTWDVPDAAFVYQANRVTRVTGTLEEFVDRTAAINPETVFISGFEQNDEFIRKIEELRVALPRTAVIPHCIQPSEGFLLQLMRSGVREVLTDDTPSAISDILGRARNRQLANNTAKARRTRCIGFMSAKGGDGCTCVSANFAAALACDLNSRILIVDLSLPFGDLEMYLTNQPSTHDLADFSDEIERLDSALVFSMVRHLSDTLHIIPSPVTFERILRITPDRIERLIDVVSGYYDYVLFDLGSGLDPLCLRAIEKIDQLFLIGAAALPSVRRASQILRLWESLGYSSSMISLILNRINGRSFLERHEVEKVLGRSISHFLPDERKLLQESLLRGKQIIDLSPRSSFSKALFEWTAEISGKPLRGKSLWQRLGIK